MKTTASHVKELDAKLNGTLARCAEKAWWHAHFHLRVMALIVRDVFADLRRSQRRAKQAAELDREAADIIRKAMGDVLDESDRANLHSALERIDASYRADAALGNDLKI